MKVIPFLLLLLFVPVFRAAAQPCATFDCAMQEAKTAYTAQDYRKAYEGFRTAKKMNRAKSAEADAWMDKTFYALEQQQIADAEKARLAEANNKNAARVLDRLYFYQNRFGLAFDKINESYGFIDKSGHILIPFKYHTLSPFDNQGFARGRKAEGQGWRIEYLIDTLGNAYRLATEIGQLDSATTALDLRNRELAVLPDMVCNYPQLQILLLNNNQLSTLPENFGKLTNLKILYLSHNVLMSLPASFSQLSSLQTLMLDDNKLSALPENFGDLKSLEDLSLYNNRIAYIPSSFGNMIRLRRLHLTVNPIGSLPESFGQLQNLEYLTLVECNLQSLPQSFGQLGKLRWLEANANQLTSLPENFGQLKMLRDLNLNTNKLKALPASFGQLSSLENFAAYGNQIAALPDGFGQLALLKGLSLGKNQIAQLPENFSQLSHLETLGISSNRLSVLPKDFGKLKNLKSIDVSDNELSSLPVEIGALDSLHELYVNRNQLDHLPEEIGQLQALNTLFAGENHLSTLPATLCQLTQLELLSYAKNPIQKLPDCIKNMSAQPPMFETILDMVGSEPSDSTYLLVAQQLLKGSYEQAYNNAQAAIQADSTDPGLYFNLSYYALFIGQYPQAIAAAQKTLLINPLSVKVETNLALGYLLNNEYDKAEAIYKKWKGKKFEADDAETADMIFLKDISELESFGIQHKDFQKVKDLFLK